MKEFKVLNYRRRFTRTNLTRKLYTSLILSAIVLCALYFTADANTFTYKGETYSKQSIETFSRGQIVEHTDEDDFCHSWILITGTSLRPTIVLIIAYFAGLVYLFLGIALVSDIFMDSIEVITSQTKAVKYTDIDGVEQTMNVSVWNPTIANLTLMALGSSAPEILLSVIETVTNLGKEPGELGPSTIVGSAAFNLMVISAVSIACIPTGETK